MIVAKVWPLELGTAGVLVAGRWLWLRAILWATLLFADAFAFFLSTQFVGPWLHLSSNAAYPVVFGIPILAFVAYAFVVHAGEKRTPIEVLPGPGTITDILIGAAIGFVMLCTTTALLWSLGLYHIRLNHGSDVLASFLFGPYLSGMLEELGFRAILLRILARAFGNRWGLVLSAALFGAAHFGHASWMNVIAIIINGGLIMGLLYMATGRLWMSIGLHTAWDFTEDFVLGVNRHNGLLLSTRRVPGRSDLLTGGAFGPDGSVLANIIGILLILAILFAWKRGLFQRTQATIPARSTTHGIWRYTRLGRSSGRGTL
jgi:membrane protease YdiL (CAAX protease family)